VPHGHGCHYGPFRVQFLPPGALKPYILRLLSERPMHGFELMQEIFDRTGGLWRPGPAAIYPTLEWLEANGYVEEVPVPDRGERTRRPFRITARGRETVRDHDRFRKEWREGVDRLREIWD
jgi:DNA-binding PadR family transcriptional regulator